MSNNTTELSIHHTDFTGLEWAVWRGEWKMAALFFIHGADPCNNAFDGVIETHASIHGYEEPEIVDGFSADNPEPIKGFKGLRLIAREDPVGHAYLFIMECIHHGALSLKKDYVELSRSLDTIANDLQYSAADLKSFTISSLLSLKKMGLNEDVTIPIIETALIDTLWSLLESFATRSES